MTQFGDPRLGGGDVIPAPAFAEPALSLSKGVNLSPHSTCLANFAHSHPQVLPLRLRLGASPRRVYEQVQAWGCHTRRGLLRGSDAVPASAKHSQTMSKNWYAEICIPYGLGASPRRVCKRVQGLGMPHASQFTAGVRRRAGVG